MAETKKERIPVALYIKVEGHVPTSTGAICKALTTFGLGYDQGWDHHMIHLYGMAPKAVLEASIVKYIWGNPRSYANEIRDAVLEANGGMCTIDVEIDMLVVHDRITSYARRAELV